MKTTDELLSAYLDNELSDSQTESLQRALSNDTEMANKLRKMQAADEKLKQAYDQILTEEIPTEVLRLIDNHTNTLDGAEKTSVVTLRPKATGQALKTWLPLAACLVLALGIGFNWSSPRSAEHGAATQTSRYQKIGFDDPRFEVLESVPSAQVVRLNPSSDQSMKVLLSFAAIDGRFCREYHLSSNANSVAEVACKNSGRWEVIASESTTPGDTDRYIPASGNSPQSISELVDEMMSGIAFDAGQEQAAIARQWMSSD